MKNQLWVEKYRPKSVEEYVFTDPNQKEQVQHWIKEESMPHLLMSAIAAILQSPAPSQAHIASRAGLSNSRQIPTRNFTTRSFKKQRQP